MENKFNDLNKDYPVHSLEDIFNDPDFFKLCPKKDSVERNGDKASNWETFIWDE